MIEFPVALDVAVAVGLSAGVVVFTTVVLRREVGLPIFVSVMVVPVVVGLGFAIAFGLQRVLDVTLLESLGLLGVLLVVLTALYEMNYSPVVRS